LEGIIALVFTLVMVVFSLVITVISIAVPIAIMGGFASTS
jgi:hypothetical protein